MTTEAQHATSLPRVFSDVIDEATGRTHRADPVTGKTGGPAGNARLTAWTGLLLLVLIAIETVTVLDVNGLIDWHVVVGTLLVPVALLKTASTSWRIGRYYTGHRSYRAAGPPPMVLRILGPLVVLTTLGLLGSGLALIALGRNAGRRSFLDVLGLRLDTLTLHQAMFIAFAVVTGLHILARIYPAVRLATGRVGGSGRVPARSMRLVVIAVTLVAATVTSVLVLGAAGEWQHDRGFDGRPGVGGPPPGGR